MLRLVEDDTAALHSSSWKSSPLATIFTDTDGLGVSATLLAAVPRCGVSRVSKPAWRLTVPASSPSGVADLEVSETGKFEDLRYRRVPVKFQPPRLDAYQGDEPRKLWVRRPGILSIRERLDAFWPPLGDERRLRRFPSLC